MGVRDRVQAPPSRSAVPRTSGLADRLFDGLIR